MIAASEPLEFIPRGRQAVEEHPGPLNVKQQNGVTSDNLLLLRMQNVNISGDDSNEFWLIRDIFEDLKTEEVENNTPSTQKKFTKSTSESCIYMTDYYVNSEEELYFKKCTAVWTRGFNSDGSVPQKTCFTTDTFLKFVFFCNTSFVESLNEKSQENKSKCTSAIGLIDSTSLRIYGNNGEYFLTNLEFPVSNVFHTKYGLILEKEASNAVVSSHSIPMPRFFTLTHPLSEMCPLLHKSPIGHISYLTEADYRIIFTTKNGELVLIYDSKIGKHFVYRLRQALEDEVNFVSCNNESNVSGLQNFSNRHGSFNISQGGLHKSGSLITRSNITQLHPTPQSSNLFRNLMVNSIQSPHSLNNSLTGGANANNRSQFQSPLMQLQSTLKSQSKSVQDLRKIGQSISQPSKPIVPEYCLEHIWTENPNSKEYSEMASTAFEHVDLLGQKYLCYLMSRIGKLQMIRIEKSSTADKYIFGMILNVSAKDAAVLDKMKMIAIIAPCGTLVLYSGPNLIAKVHITSALQNFGPSSAISSSFPRRSSLLPTIQQPTDVPFEEDELHMLSPVHPLMPQVSHKSTSTYMSLRDPSGNRITLVYPGGKMYRITLPLINESHFITKCIFALRQILKKDLYIQVLTKWYVARNAPGSQDFSNEQEWETFKNVLSELLGRSFSSNECNSNTSGSEEPKKRRKKENILGTDEDWDNLEKILYLCENNQYPTHDNDLHQEKSMILHNNSSAPLFPHIPIIFYTFHLIYEEIKLDSSMQVYMKYLSQFLYNWATDMILDSYCLHYVLDFPHLIHCRNNENFFSNDDAKKMYNKVLLTDPVPSIYATITDIIRGDKTKPKYPYIFNVNTLSKSVIQLVSLICHTHQNIKTWFEYIQFPGTASAEVSKAVKRSIPTDIPLPYQVLQMLLQLNMTRTDIERLPPAINFIISQVLEYCRIDPPTGYEFKAYELILRPDLVAHASYQPNQNIFSDIKSQSSPNAKEDALTPRVPPPPDIVSVNTENTSSSSTSTSTVADGMENIDSKLLRLRFAYDLRTTEVRRMLNSSEPVIIDITQSAGVTDHEFIEEQEKQLYATCTRTMTLPMGRGMFTLRTANPVSTESITIPKLCLSGKEPTKGATIEMQQIEFPANMNLWPTFHNGVAAGLKINQNAKAVDSTWIVFNKPKGQVDIATEHAGLLMGLGLNGHLKSLSLLSVYDYLVKCDEMTGIGLLLGISAAYRGTMDITTTKVLSVHIEALLPATSIELDIPQNVQIASLMGIGLLYQGTAKRHIANILLQEIGRPPGPEMENCIERESYSLTAGLALGLVTLGKGDSPAGLQDLQIPDTLHYYMVGGNKRPLSGSQKEKYKLPSFPVREGDTVNIDVTSPGATLALGLMFFNTGNQAIAQWMKPPDTSYLLDLIRPDLLLLRIIARGLILWDGIEPTPKWLFDQFPGTLKFDLKRGPLLIGPEIDHEANAQAFCNIIAGAAFCIGLRYAGTSNMPAFVTLKRAIDMFLSMGGKYVGEYAGKTTVENCLILTVISLSLVFSGSGNIKILRIIRYLRSRIGPAYSHITYGSHMAIHMALGFLFLGAGRYTLSRTPESIAALICALFPKFPNHSNDNRYHLQAFRHLYVLAVEPRLFLPRDIDTGKLCLCQISCFEINSNEAKKLPIAPCMLPELSTLKKIIVNDPNYWPICFERGRNWDQLERILQNCDCIDIKKRAGCMSLLEDPDRLKSLLAQTLTTEQYSCWKIEPKSLLLFSNDKRVTTYSKKCLSIDKTKDDITKDEIQRSQIFMILFYKCLTKDKMHALSIYLSILNAFDRIDTQSNCQDIWQFKILNAFQHYMNDDILVSKEIIDSIQCKLETLMETWRSMYLDALNEFLLYPKSNIMLNASNTCLRKITAVISFYDLLPNIADSIDLTKIQNAKSNRKYNNIKLLFELKRIGFRPHSIDSITKILNMIT